MTDIDRLLTDLRNAPADPRLTGMSRAILDGVAVRLEQRQTRRQLVAMGCLALFLGVAGGLFSTGGARAEPPIALNQVPANAPSALLIGER
ncbi:MAG: hypothetical protein J0G94_06870 [Sphingomonadales bacterium]|nr:hypothetical protein [Sphingomonadales bacterium]